MVPEIHLLASPDWKDYELIDSGDGLKLERFGSYTFIRPEVQALWTRSLPSSSWDTAHAIFQPSGEESGGHWKFLKTVPNQWEMKYPLSTGRSIHSSQNSIKIGDLCFWAMTTPGRHLGVFPECGAQWDWMAGLIRDRRIETHKLRTVPEESKVIETSPRDKKGSSTIKDDNVKVLNLFGYTGLASLACAAAGAQVTHVDASKKAVGWARTNQALSDLTGEPIRWIVDDALKYVEREARRGVKYDGVLLDPPKFGRGPKGEVWEVYKSLPKLLQACREVLSDHPLFTILSVYAVKMPAIHVYSALAEMMKGYGGDLECGELATKEASSGKLLSQAVYARWNR
jgi:23S rRNA (cytosine1962-C5)-methyltransferase